MICSVWTWAASSGNWSGRVRRAITTSSSDALPARSPRPLIVTSTWRAPAWTAASVFAVARPRSLWQWTLTVASRPIAVADAADERAELGRDRVADGVRDVDGRGAGLDDGLVDVEQERRPRSATRPRRRTRSRRRGPASRGPTSTQRTASASASSRSIPQLVLEVDVAGRDEQVEVRPLGDADRLDGALRVAVAAARERGDRDPALGLLRDPPDRLEVAGRGGRKAGLDDVDLEPRELARDLELLGRGEPGAGRLLAVPERGVEDADPARRDAAAEAGLDGLERHRDPFPAGTAAGVALATACAWPASTTTGLRNGICDRRSAPTCSIWWFRSCSRSRWNSSPPDSWTAIQRVANAPHWMSVEDVLHRGLGALGHPRPGDVVAVLRGVGHAEAHEVEPAAVHEVHDQLELVHRLEVRELGLVARLDQRLERRLDQRRHAAAQQRLLAEQVGLGLLLERRLEDAGPRGADAPGVGERPGAGRARRVLLDREQRRHAAALLVHAAQEVAGALGRDHPDVDVGPGGWIRANRMLNPWANISSCPGRRLGSISRVVDRLLERVRDGDHDHVGGLDRLGDVLDPKPAASATARLLEPAARPTTTSTPLSRRFSAWAWPWLP